MPGVRQIDLTATFLHRVFELGADANVLDPIWQVMPASQAERVWTIHGDIALPLLTTERELVRGDVLWVDVGISCGGYRSDFGRTWVVGQDPTPRQQAQYARWTEIDDAVRAVTRAGATGADLTTAAIEVTATAPAVDGALLPRPRPGRRRAETPYVGTDLGDEYDQRLVLDAGTVLVIEPIVWDEGPGGYRSENVMRHHRRRVHPLSDYPYTPMATEVWPDDRALRFGRRERALAAMEAHDLDVLVLGRVANIRYVSGVPILWNAGTRPFGPGCVAGARHRGHPPAQHLGRGRSRGHPPRAPVRDHLEPDEHVEVLRGIEGAAGARRVGTDAMSPPFAQLLPVAFPDAEIVDGELALRAARRIKTAEELAVLRQAVAVAETSLATAVAELRPGVSERELTGVLLEAAAAGGVTTPAAQDAACVTSRDHPWRRAAGDGRAAPGDLVAFDAGVVADGYIGEVGRTCAVGGLVSAGPVSAGPVPTALAQRCDRLWERLLAACRPGASASALLDGYAGAGEALPPMPVARGLGLGFDEPVVTGGPAADGAGRAPRPGRRARRHRLRLRSGHRSGLPPRHRAHHRRRPGGADVRPRRPHRLTRSTEESP